MPLKLCPSPRDSANYSPGISGVLPTLLYLFCINSCLFWCQPTLGVLTARRNPVVAGVLACSHPFLICDFSAPHLIAQFSGWMMATEPQAAPSAFHSMNAWDIVSIHCCCLLQNAPLTGHCDLMLMLPARTPKDSGVFAWMLPAVWNGFGTPAQAIGSGHSRSRVTVWIPSSSTILWKHLKTHRHPSTKIKIKTWGKNVAMWTSLWFVADIFEERKRTPGGNCQTWNYISIVQTFEMLFLIPASGASSPDWNHSNLKKSDEEEEVNPFPAHSFFQILPPPSAATVSSQGSQPHLNKKIVGRNGSAPPKRHSGQKTKHNFLIQHLSPLKCALSCQSFFCWLHNALLKRKTGSIPDATSGDVPRPKESSGGYPVPAAMWDWPPGVRCNAEVVASCVCLVPSMGKPSSWPTWP